MKWTKSYVCILCLLVLDGFFENIIFPLTVQLLELSICSRYYRYHSGILDPLKEGDCKIRQIQARLAFIRGIYSLCRNGSAILVGPFFGALADRSGRRIAYAISVVGLLLQTLALHVVCTSNQIFPTEAALLTGLLIMIGGGPFVIISLSFAMVADISKLEDRSRYLYLAQAVRYAANMISPQLAAQVIEHSPWLSSLTASLFLLACYPVLLFVNETRPDNKATTPVHQEAMSVPHNGSIYSLLRDRNVVLCVALTFLLQFRYLCESILIVYVPVRFGWSTSQITRLLSIIPAVSLALFAVLPFVQARTFKSFTEHRKTYAVLLMLIILLIFGSTLIVLATRVTVLIIALFIFAAGNGARAPLFSVAASYVDQASETATLYTLLSITDAFAHVVGDPTLEFVWQGALNIGPPWLALPFGVTTVMFSLALLLAFCLPSKHATHVSPEGESANATTPLLRESGI